LIEYFEKLKNLMDIIKDLNKEANSLIVILENKLKSFFEFKKL
jgi:hypothetical protein